MYLNLFLSFFLSFFLSSNFVIDYINTGELAFGRTSRYIQLVSKEEATIEYAEKWDDTIQKWNQIYCKRMHNLFWDNCHSHCKNILNELEYKNCTHWNMGILGAWMFFYGKFVRFWYVILPSVVLYCIIAVLIVVL